MGAASCPTSANSSAAVATGQVSKLSEAKCPQNEALAPLRLHKSVEHPSLAQKNGPSPKITAHPQIKQQNSYASNGSAGTPAHIQMPKLSAAQIENRRFSIYIKNLAIQAPENPRSQVAICKEVREYINS